MDLRNRIGLYGAYFLGMAGIGFTLPFLPLYLGQLGLTDREISLISAAAALTALAQFPIGIWSDRLGTRKPFLITFLALLGISTLLLYEAPSGIVWLGVLVILFAENGICRAVIESLSGAEATHLAPPNEVGAALGALRFWKPISIVLVALLAGFIEEQEGVRSVLLPLAGIQFLAVAAALLIHEQRAVLNPLLGFTDRQTALSEGCLGLKDKTLWRFIAAMVLFHAANAPAGVYLGLFLKRDLAASGKYLSYAFIISMTAWMLLVRPVGRLADRIGRRPLLLLGWGAMALRLGLLALATEPWQILAIQFLDGVAGGMFAVLAAAWVTDRLADPRRVGEAQVIVGCSLVGGSAIGPALAGLFVESLGYRNTFWALTAVGVAALVLIVVAVPDTAPRLVAEGDMSSADCKSAATKSAALEARRL